MPSLLPRTKPTLAALCGLALGLTACADWARRPTFPLEAGGQPVVQEQAVLGVSDQGVAVAQLLFAEADEPSLTLLVFAADGRSSRTVESRSDGSTSAAK